MIKQLQQNPDKLFQITNDSEAKVLLLELGLMGTFSNRVEGIESPTEAVTGECSTHYILAMLFSGRTKPEDNGYVVYGFPKSKCSPEKAMAMTEDILKQAGMLHAVKNISKSSN